MLSSLGAGTRGDPKHHAMVLLTLIARVRDGLPLSASMEEDEERLKPYKDKAKMLFRKLDETSPTRCTLETGGSYNFHYNIEAGVCYLVLCEVNFPKRLAFGYLEALQKEFHSQHGAEIASVTRPYHFIAFDTFIQKTKRGYNDTRGARRNLGRLNDELQDVQKIMMRNIEDVLGRGEMVDSLATKSASLSAASRKYAKDASMLKWKAMLQKWSPVIAVCLVVLIFLWIRYG